MATVSAEAKRRAGSRSGAFALVGLATAALATVVYPIPLWTGSVIPDQRAYLPSAHVKVPDDWHQVATAINRTASAGKVLVLPLDDFYQMPTNWGYYGVDSIAASLIKRPVLQDPPGGYFTPNRSY